MICQACGSVLATIEYQARAADEPQRIITKCTSCPLDGSKLNIFNDPLPSHIHLRAFERHQEEKPLIDSSHASAVHVLYARLPSSFASNDDSQLNDARCIDAIDNNGRLFRSYMSGPFCNQSVHVSSMKQIAPHVSLRLLHVMPHDGIPGTPYTHFTYKQIRMNDKNAHAYQMNGKWELIVPLNDNSDHAIQETLYELYLEHIHLKTLADLMPRITLGALSNLSARARDAPSIPDGEYQYSTKADGERIWISRMGCVWISSRRIKNEIIGWDIDDTINANEQMTIGPVIDTEMMMNHKSILIDVLMDDNSSLSPRTRNLDWIYGAFDDLHARYSYLSNVIKRGFFNDLADAQRYRDAVRYPTDGIVALPVNGIDMIKLKEIKSIELLLQQDGTLISAEGTPIFKIQMMDGFSHGSIYEVGFSVSDGSFKFHHIHIRPDKDRANSMDAIKSVIESTFERLPNDAIRMALWRWSNNVRAEVYQRAHAFMPDRRVILDIGTGDGQASDNHMKSSSSKCSYIMIEKDATKCEALRRRLNLRSYETNPKVLNRVMSQLKRGALTYIVINCTIQSILENKDLCRMMLPELKCVVACFSAQFIADCMDVIISAGVPFIGACYVYDGIDIGESIINASGLYMTKVDYNIAMVQWGRDVPYHEPAIETHDFPAQVVFVDANQIVRFPMMRGLEDTDRVTRSLKILMSR